ERIGCVMPHTSSQERFSIAETASPNRIQQSPEALQGGYKPRKKITTDAAIIRKMCSPRFTTSSQLMHVSDLQNPYAAGLTLTVRPNAFITFKTVPRLGLPSGDSAL